MVTRAEALNLIIDQNINFEEEVKRPDEAAYVKPVSWWTEQVIGKQNEIAQHLGLRLPWNKADGIQFRPKEISVWVGINGHGKSNMLGQVMLWACRTTEYKVCIASFEMAPEATLSRIVNQASGRGAPTPDITRSILNQLEGRMWLYDQNNRVDRHRLALVIRWCNSKLGINHFVIDSLMKVGISREDYDKQADFVNELTVIAKDLEMHIHLVVHPRKQEGEHVIPGKFEVLGGGEITNLADNCLTVWKNKPKYETIERVEMMERSGITIPKDIQEKYDKALKSPDAILKVTKQRHAAGWEGRISLWFHEPSMQFIPTNEKRPMRFEIT